MILWDKRKNKKLIEERNLDFEKIAKLIITEGYVDVIEHPKKAGQFLFIVSIYDYIHAVPFVIDKKENIILKTVFPSRKYNRIYGGKNNEKKNKT